MRKTFAILAAAVFVLSFSAVALAGGANCTASKTDAATASAAGCTQSSSVKTASAGGCNPSACMSASGAKVAMETVRMPSGTLAIFYRGNDDTTVAKLQSGALEKGAEFGCELAHSVAVNDNCSVEVANIDGGIMLLVSSEKAEALDQIEAQYATAIQAHHSDAHGSGE